MRYYRESLYSTGEIIQRVYTVQVRYYREKSILGRTGHTSISSTEGFRVRGRESW